MSKVNMSINFYEPNTYLEDFRTCIKIDEKLLHKIKIIVNELSDKHYPYDALCWALAEFQMIFEKGKKNFSEKEVVNRFNKINDSDLSYEVVCQLIPFLKVYLEEIKLYP
ncbi:MAG: hypothetical protein ACFFA3_07205 [Promethearchaeota archaeon]